MAVNYGLGGFKDGAAYISAYSTSEEIVSIATISTPVVIEAPLTITNYLDAEKNASADYQLDLQLGGYWLITYSLTTTGASNDNFTCGIGLETSTLLDEGRQSFNSKAGDFFTTNGSAILEIESPATTLYTLIQNDSDTDNITIANLNISAIRIGDLLNSTKTGARNPAQYKAGTAYGAFYWEGSTALSYVAVDTYYKFGISLTEGQSCLVDLISASDAFTIEQAGFYRYECSISISGSSNDDLSLGIFKNGVADTNVIATAKQNFNAKGGSLWQTGLSTLLYLQKGDTLQPCIANLTDTSGNTTFKNINLNLVRIGNI